MPTKIITIPTANTAFHHLAALRNNRAKRTSEGKFIVEGVRSINNALKYGWDIKGWVYSSDRRLSSWGQGMLQKASGATHYRVANELLEQLSQKDEASELLAVVSMPKDDLKRIALSDSATVIVFDRPSSPGNLGAIMRSADAFGVGGIIVTGHGVDPYSQETVSASTGSLFAVPLVRLSSHKEVAAWVKELKKSQSKLSVVATDEKGEAQIDRHDFSGPTVLLIGNETHGLSNAYMELADRTVFYSNGRLGFVTECCCRHLDYPLRNATPAKAESIRMAAYLISGPSGSGKSSVGRELQKRGFKVIETDFEPGFSGWAGFIRRHLRDSQ